MDFKEMLDTLTQSYKDVAKAASYAYVEQNRQFCHSLYECIKERMEEVSVSNRVPLVYVLDSMMGMSVKHGFSGYADLTRKDIEWIVTMAVPESDPSQLIKIKKVVRGWRQRGIFSAAELESVEAYLASVQKSVGPTSERESERSQVLTKQDILKKMEEDRDKHKKAREDGWSRLGPVNDTRRPTTPRPPLREEFEELWEKIDGMTDTDWANMIEEETRFRVSMKAASTRM
ncbi:hypothetical protein DFJ73DRAFT_798129 [Zopfochytrium polystomum]|nr:hypothetical protein DFJ73DRAFT_798129 [Zopfochytrium polystomum]